MEEELKERILEILKKAQTAVSKDDIKSLKDLSNLIVDSASIHQDTDSVTMTVMIYSLSKIFERSDYRKTKGWDIFYKNVVNNLKDAYLQLYNGHFDKYREKIKGILDVIDKLDSKLKKYVKEVIERAYIAKGSRFHEHGISVGRVAEMLGISKWELMEYIGKTGIPDVPDNIDRSISRRIYTARKLFK